MNVQTLSGTLLSSVLSAYLVLQGPSRFLSFAFDGKSLTGSEVSLKTNANFMSEDGSFAALLSLVCAMAANQAV